MIPESQIDPRIAVHLLPGERVLWQGAPRGDTFFGTPQIATSAGLALLGVLLAVGALDGVLPALAGATGAARQVPALAALAAAGLILHSNWSRRGTLWAYAITDRRLLSVLGGKLIRSVSPAHLDAAGLDIAGDTVYWARSPRSADDRTVIEGMRKGPDHPLIGFHGQADPQALRARILSWRRSLTETATAQAARFVAERPSGVSEAPAPETPHKPGQPGRYRHADSGLHLDVPEGWKVTVQTRRQRSLGPLGRNFLPGLVTDTAPAPYSGETGWNLLRATTGDPKVSFEIHIREGKLETTLQSVTEDPLAALAGLTPLDETPDLSIAGGYRGFALRRVAAETAGPDAGVLQQIWLSNGRHVLEGQGSAPRDNPLLTAAIDQIFRSIGA